MSTKKFAKTTVVIGSGKERETIEAGSDLSKVDAKVVAQLDDLGLVNEVVVKAPQKKEAKKDAKK